MATWQHALEDRWAKQRVIDEQKLLDRERVGDDLSRPRLVAHIAYFRDVKSCRSAANYFEQQGFDVRVVTHRERCVLRFEHESPLQGHVMETVARDIILVVSAHGGTYNGWTAAHVLGTSVPPLHVAHGTDES